MDVFLTGATGFLGGHVARRLVDGGHAITCLVRDVERASWLQDLGADLVQGGLGDVASLERGVGASEGVVHLAAVNTHWEPDRNRYREANIHGTRNVLRAAEKAGVQRVVYLSTALVYGRPVDTPFVEDSEPGPKRFSTYARSKLTADRIAERIRRESGLPLVTIYPGGITGPGNSKQTSQYIRMLVERKMPGVMFPDVRHTYVDVRDVAEIVARSLESPVAAGRHYLAGKEALSMAELNNLVSEIAGVPKPRMPFPGPLAKLLARSTTAIASLTGRPPLGGLMYDSILTMEAGLDFDGSRAERELGMTYRPVRQSIADEIAAYG